MIGKTMGFAAGAMIASQGQALDWSDVTEMAKSVEWGQLAESALGINVFEHDFELTNHHHVRAKTSQQKRRVKPLTAEQRKRSNDAHHSLMAQRARLGLPMVGQGPNVQQNYAQLNSASGFILNLLTGMAYNGDATNSKCYNAAEDMIISLDTSTDVFKKMWIPAYLAEAQIQVQDLVAILAATYIDCSIDKVFLTLTNLASSEGVASASGRVAGAMPFEFGRCQKAYQNPKFYSTGEKGVIYGKCLSILLNYTI